MIAVMQGIHLGDEEVQLSFVRASGPGGQNVNKVSTAVQLRFDVARSPSLTDDVRARLAGLCGSRLTGEGVLIIDARRYRSQERNRFDAMERLLVLIRQAAVAPKPRRKLRRSRAWNEERLQEKRHCAMRKAQRRGSFDE